MIEMPHLITLDFETFYDTKFSLSRLTTEEYIRSSDFEIIGVGIKIDDAPAYWVSGSREMLNKHLLSLPWKESGLLCHNTMFDGAILAWSLKIFPLTYLDTLSMARGIKSEVRRHAKRFWRSSADENKSDNGQTNIRAG
jgi:hypothetical protein